MVDRSHASREDHDTTEPTRVMNRRRNFLRKIGATGVLTGLGASSVDTAAARKRKDEPFNGDDPFTLGIASGDPLPDSVVLWTRLAPEPLEEDGGMPDRKIPVNWKVATDKKMRNIIQEGSAHARPEFAHSVHVNVQELEPSTEYYYQFRVGSNQTTVGRTKTAPAADASLDEISFAFTSCQQQPQGYYTAHQHLADEDLDLVIHLGDYIYEGSDQGSYDRGHKPPRSCQDLSDYRIRYGQYKSESNLQAAHAAFPWIVTWDDHEVANNYSDGQFLERRAAAYQAYWEHQPLRWSRLPDGPDMPLYRRFTFGELVEFNVLDTRQYRDAQTGSSEEAKDPERTLLGDEQENWLVEGLTTSSSRWDVLANQVPFAATDEDSDPDEIDFGGGDKWDGYREDRKTILDVMAQETGLNPIIITGDVHRNIAYDIKADFSVPNSEIVGTEYVGTSMSSFGDGSGVRQYGGASTGPWMQFYNDERGYVRCTITAEQWQTDYRVVSTVEERTASIQTLATFVTEPGDPGAELVSGPDPYPNTDYSEYETISQSEMSVTASSWHPGREPFKTIDGYWDTQWSAQWDAELPESVTIDLGGSYEVETLIYLPRQGGVNGIATKYKIYTSSDGETFDEVANGSWPMDAEPKTATLPSPQQARHVRFEIVEGYGGFATAAEINISTTSD